jgi:Fur family ferric uptake transcriptional regulator
MVKRRPEDILAGVKLRRTPGRMALLNVLLEAKTPLTHDELFARVRRRNIDRVTVYRALQTFMDAGIVHRIDPGDRLWRFAVCGTVHQGHCHPHFTCRVCGTVECLNDVALPRIEKPRPAYSVEEQEMYMRGVCARCGAAGA